MSSLNRPPSYPSITTHEDAPAMRISALKELRRSVMTAMLWENSFYETGNVVAKRIQELVPQCNPVVVAALAIEARDSMYLRHVPLFLVRQLARVKGNGTLVADTLAHVIQRPDELGEYLAMYWGGVKSRPEPLSAGSKRGLAAAFKKFSPYQLAKYNRDTGIKLVDVLRLVHAKPNRFDGSVSDMTIDAVYKRFTFKCKPGDASADSSNSEQTHRVRRDVAGQGALWGQLIAGTLATPDTWETQLSAGADKKETFERLLREEKLGALAFLRNLRNMIESGVDLELIRARFKGNLDKVLPFRYLAAVRHAPSLAVELNDAMLKAVSTEAKLPGNTVILVDVSASMDQPLSAKSDMKRIDAGAGLAVLMREVCDNCRVFTFSNSLVEVAAHRGLPLATAINNSQQHANTYLGAAINTLMTATMQTPQRLIIITDEQSHDTVHYPVGVERGYVINIATYQNGVGYGKWTHIDGWSEKVLDFMRAVEGESID